LLRAQQRGGLRLAKYRRIGTRQIFHHAAGRQRQQRTRDQADAAPLEEADGSAGGGGDQPHAERVGGCADWRDDAADIGHPGEPHRVGFGKGVALA
jgi:hypothetical protein